MRYRKYKMLRNIFIVIGIIGGFAIWLFIPAEIKNDTLLHVGNSSHGSKWGLLLLLVIPLFALIQNKEELTFHSDDEELKNAVLNKAAQKQMIYAIVNSSIVIILMFIGLLR